MAQLRRTRERTMMVRDCFYYLFGLGSLTPYFFFQPPHFPLLTLLNVLFYPLFSKLY